jgi:hypothetical protein
MPYRPLTALPRRRTQPAEGAFPGSEAGRSRHSDKSPGQRPGAGEPACRPGSVPPLTRGGGHPSGTAVAGSLVRSTREHRAGRPRSLTQGTVAPLLTLLRVGFTEPPQSPAALVVSYTTVSPLPLLAQRRSVFCGTVPRVTPGRRYRPPCLVEPGPSSPGLRPARPPGRLTHA